MERNIAQEIKVALFVLFFTAVLAVSVFILGGGMKLLEPKYNLNIWFNDVKGLRVGAVVRLAGIPVGMVEEVDFPNDPNAPDNVHVVISIEEQVSARIRADSEARLTTQGLLGDVYITLSVGTPNAAQLRDEDTLRTAKVTDVDALTKQGEEVLASAKSITKKLDLMLGTEESAAKSDLAGSVAKISTILEDAQKGKGVLHTLVYDEAAASDLKASMDNLASISGELRSVSREIRTGDGLANALIYGEGGKDLVKQINEVSGAIEGLMGDLRNEKSVAHALLYDPQQAKMVEDLSATATSLRQIADAINKGEGTAGLLVNDPQAYEDLRALLGGARRNALLRAYIRATIAQGEANGEAWKAPSDDPSLGGGSQ